MKSKIAAIILAAGYSSRMGRTKALLPFGGCTLVEKQIRLFQNAGVDKIYVVLGHDGERIVEVIRQYGVQTVWNGRYAEGMFSSICAGVQAIDGQGFDSFLFLPVDYALIRPHLVMRLIRGFEQSGSSLAYVKYQGKKGHPPIFSASYIRTILTHDGQNGIKGAIKRFDPIAHYEHMSNRECLIDLDTWEDYEQALVYFEGKTAPDAMECEDILTLAELPPPVTEHCRAVSRAAGRLARAAAGCGAELDAELCAAAGLLHDIKRTEKRHAEKGAAWLRELGYPCVADIIGNHMDLDAAYASHICEQSIVYLADKICEGGRIVPLEERMLRCTADADKARFARQRLLAAQRIQEQLERLVRQPVGNILAGG